MTSLPCLAHFPAYVNFNFKFCQEARQKPPSGHSYSVLLLEWLL